MENFYGRLAELISVAESRFPSWSDTIEAMAYAESKDVPIVFADSTAFAPNLVNETTQGGGDT